MPSFNRGEMVTGLTQGRINSTFNGAYEFSAFLLLILPLYLNAILTNKSKKIKNILITLIILFCIYVTESRTSLIIALFIILFMFVKATKISTKKLAFSFLIIILIGITFTVGNPLNNIDLSRFESVNMSGIIKIFDITWEYKNFEQYLLTGSWYGDSPYSLTEVGRLGMDASLYARVSHWMQMIDGVLESPIIGLGASVSNGASDGNYIRILAESGILGLCIWCVLLYYIYKSLDSKNEFQKITKYALITLIIGAIVIDVFEASKVMMMFWFMLGVSYANEEVKNNTNNKLLK